MLETIIDFYKVRGVTELENSANSVGWSSKESQYKRFEVLYDVGITKEDTVLDYGCGLGHLIDFLKACGHNTTEKYFGIDVLNEFILAAKKIYPGHKFLTTDIYNIKERFDYVVGSGTFTIGTTQEEMLLAIRSVYRLVNKGFTFNLMHEKHKMSSNKYFKTYNPDTILHLLQKEFNNIKINNEYAVNQDFTVYIYK